MSMHIGTGLTNWSTLREIRENINESKKKSFQYQAPPLNKTPFRFALELLIFVSYLHTIHPLVAA